MNLEKETSFGFVFFFLILIFFNCTRTCNEYPQIFRDYFVAGKTVETLSARRRNSLYKSGRGL